jgi:hypothetical protein
MPKVNNVTRPVDYSDLQVDEIIEFGSCTSEWVIRENDGRVLVLEQIKGSQVGQMTHTSSPVQRVEPRNEIAQNVQVSIVDLATDDAVNLATDVARRAMIDAGMPVGPTTPVQLGAFEGDYLVDLPIEWYDDLEESGEDFWAETGNVAVTVIVP